MLTVSMSNAPLVASSQRSFAKRMQPAKPVEGAELSKPAKLTEANDLVVRAKPITVASRAKLRELVKLAMPAVETQNQPHRSHKSIQPSGQQRHLEQLP